MLNKLFAYNWKGCHLNQRDNYKDAGDRGAQDSYPDIYENGSRIKPEDSSHSLGMTTGSVTSISEKTTYKSTWLKGLQNLIQGKC
jgi:hypothetical protein